MGNLLFSPNGVVDGQAFIKGAVVLLAVNFFLWLTWFVNVGFGFLAAFASFGLIYCWACLFAKRLRGVGKSTSLFALVFIGFLVLSYILANFLALALSPDLVGQVAEMQELQENDPENIEAIMASFSGLMKSMAVPYAVSYFIAGSIMAFGVNGLLKSKA